MTDIVNDLEPDNELEVQDRPKVMLPEIVSFNISEPDVPLSPDHEPVAEQLVALEVDQVNVVSSPIKGEVRLEEIVMLIGGLTGALGVGAGELPPPPPPPQEVIKTTDVTSKSKFFIFLIYTYFKKFKNSPRAYLFIIGNTKRMGPMVNFFIDFIGFIWTRCEPTAKKRTL